MGDVVNEHKRSSIDIEKPSEEIDIDELYLKVAFELIRLLSPKDNSILEVESRLIEKGKICTH